MWFDDAPAVAQLDFEEAVRSHFSIGWDRAPVMIASIALFVGARLAWPASPALALTVGLWCGYCVSFVATPLIGRGLSTATGRTGRLVSIALAILVGAAVGRGVERALWSVEGLDWRDQAMRLSLHLIFIGTLILIPVMQALVAARRLARAEEERARLMSKLIALQAQIEPHFLFNTLATLRSLIRRDAAKAADLLDRMTAFLRAVLPEARQVESTVSREIDIVASYLAIMQLRLGPRLAYSIDVAPETLAASAPPLLLQPLVENAIKHGIDPSEAGGSITITVRAEDDALTIAVKNTGEGLCARPDESTSDSDRARTGLLNVRHRLAALYGPDAALSLVSDTSGATIATLSLPVGPTA